MRQGNIIGGRIRLLRELRRWTQRQFAKKLRNAGHNVSRDIVARWELCATPVTDAWILGIADRPAGFPFLLDLFPPRGRGRPRVF